MSRAGVPRQGDRQSPACACSSGLPVTLICVFPSLRSPVDAASALRQNFRRQNRVVHRSLCLVGSSRVVEMFLSSSAPILPLDSRVSQLLESVLPRWREGKRPSVEARKRERRPTSSAFLSLSRWCRSFLPLEAESNSRMRCGTFNPILISSRNSPAQEPRQRVDAVRCTTAAQQSRRLPACVSVWR